MLMIQTIGGRQLEQLVLLQPKFDNERREDDAISVESSIEKGAIGIVVAGHETGIGPKQTEESHEKIDIYVRVGKLRNRNRIERASPALDDGTSKIRDEFAPASLSKIVHVGPVSIALPPRGYREMGKIKKKKLERFEIDMAISILAVLKQREKVPDRVLLVAANELYQMLRQIREREPVFRAESQLNQHRK